ncbi:Reticulon-like protein B5 [Camellia lanceoleosa]|uniref:Reticulon-like protein B5 n=1 Tax=Camellia lanceoleosa TaxID=1840588 RepID=A0ACC0G3I1_9ERIC|nr:Reticulon-like protein B5 [Camellia lanceoleosa]
MADHDGDQNEPVVEAVNEKIDGHDSSSSLDSDTEKKPSSASVVKKQIYHLFGREKPVHKIYHLSFSSYICVCNLYIHTVLDDHQCRTIDLRNLSSVLSKQRNYKML